MCAPTRVLIAPMKSTPVTHNMFLPWMYGEAGGPMWPKKEWKDMYESVPTGTMNGRGSKDTDLKQAKAHALYNRPYSKSKSSQSAIPAEYTNAYQRHKANTGPEVGMEQPPSSGSGSSNKTDDMPPSPIVKKTVPAPTVFWNDHLRMI